MSEVIQSGVSGKSIEVMLRRSDTMQGLTGLAYNTAGLTFAFSRDIHAPVAITLVTQTVTGSWASGGFVEKDATKTPGLYRLDLPDAAIATLSGVSKVRVMWTGATNLLDDGVDIDLTSYDPTTVDPNVAAIKAKTDNLPATPADGTVIATATSSLATAVGALPSASAIWANATRTLSDKTGFALTSAERVSIRQEIDTNSSQLQTLIGAAGTLSTAITNLNNLSALANLFGPAVMEVPISSTRPYPYTLTVRDSEGHLVDMDATPTLAIANSVGTDRSGNLSVVAHPSLGVYTFTYTVAAAAAEEGLRLTATGAVSSSARRADLVLSIVSVDTMTQLTAIANTVNAVKTETDTIAALPTAAQIRAEMDSNSTRLAAINTKTTNLPTDPASEAVATTNKNAVLTRIGTPFGASVAVDIAALPTATTVNAIRAKTDNLPAAPADETAVIAATNAIASAIAALHNLDSTQAQAAVASALTAYVAAKTSDIPSAAVIVDKLLGRNQKGGTDGPANQSVAAAFAAGFMDFTIDPITNILTMKYADGTTAFTRQLTRSALDSIVSSS